MSARFKPSKKTSLKSLEITVDHNSFHKVGGTSSIAVVTQQKPTKASKTVVPEPSKDIPLIDLDFEKLSEKTEEEIIKDPLHKNLVFPPNDLQVADTQKDCRTVIKPTLSDSNIAPYVKECFEQLSNDYCVVKFNNAHYALENKIAVYSGEVEAIKFETDIDFDDDKKKKGVGEIFGEGVKHKEFDQDIITVKDASSICFEGDRYNLLNLYNRLKEYQNDESDKLNRIQTEETERRCGNVVLPPSFGEKRAVFQIDLQKLNFAGKANELEPFTVSFAIHEIGPDQKRKVSESYYPHVNSPEVQAMYGKHNITDPDVSTLSTSGVFSVSSKAKHDLYLIVKVDRILMGDVADAHFRENDAKHGQKHKLSVESAMARLGQYRQPFCWGFCILHSNDQEYNGDNESEIGPLFRQENDKLDDKELYKIISEGGSKKTTLMRKLKIVPNSSITVCVKKLEEHDVPNNQVDPMLNPLLPEGSGPIVRSVLDFSEGPRLGEEFLNCFYIYPKLLQFESGNGRNLALKFEFLDGDDLISPPLMLIHGKSHCKALNNFAYTNVSYHRKQPSFYDEIKVNLPLKLSKKHHIKISIYHVHTKAIKKYVTCPEEPVGFAVFPLLTEQGCVNSDSMYNLPVAQELSDGYLPFCGIDTTADDPNTVGPIRWYDNRNPLLTMQFKMVSTLHTQDCYLHAFFEEDYSNIDENRLCNALVRLSNSDKDQILRFLPIILNRLFYFLCQPVSDKTKQQIMLALRTILAKVNDAGGRDRYLDKYIKFDFRSNKGNEIVFSELITQWNILLQDEKTKIKFLKYSWFFFEVIEKSAIMYLVSNDLIKLKRGQRFTSNLMSTFKSLIMLLLSQIRILFTSEIQYLLAQSLNRNLAFFLRNCFSYMDRSIIFNLIQHHLKSITMKDSIALVENKFVFLHIIMMYEHYLPMCIPVSPAEEPHKLTSDNPAFRETHAFISLLMSEVSMQFSISVGEDANKEGEIRKRIVLMLKHLLGKLIFDPRYEGKSIKHRIGVLHFPLLLFILDNSSRLNHHIGKSKGAAKGEKKTLALQKDEDDGRLFTFAETRGLCLCFLSLFKCLENDYVVHWLNHESAIRIQSLITVLKACVACFQYRGRHRIDGLKGNKAEASLKKVDAQTAKEALAGQYENIMSARERLAAMREQRQQRSEMDAKSGTTSVNSETYNTLRRRTMQSCLEGLSEEAKQTEINCQQALCTEASFQVLEFYDLLVSKDFGISNDIGIWDRLCAFLVHILEYNQSENVILKVISCVTSFIEKKPEVVFEGSTDFCSSLCRELLRYCNSRFETVRTNASAAIYILMRMNFDHTGMNFTRMSIQFAMVVSKIIGSFENVKPSHDTPRPISQRDGVSRFLHNANIFCEMDNDADERFKTQLFQMVKNLTRICEDTMSMQINANDPDLYCDMQYRIAKGYSHSPDLRLAWLQNIENFHQEHNNLAEVAMCRVHMCALVAEYLFTMDYHEALPPGSAAFIKISPNALEESAIAADIQDEEGMCCSSDFTQQGFSILLETCITALTKASMFEAVPQLSKLLIPIYEKNREYEWLRVIYKTIFDVHDLIIKAMEQNKRLFGTYFRVKFVGSVFEELGGKEFIYKEPKITPLVQIRTRLETFYTGKFGSETIEIYQEADEMDLSKLDPNKNYIQITHVQPFFDDVEDRSRVGQFERDNHIRRFVYDTPYTLSGKAHGEIDEQCIKRTVLDISHCFPYIKKRIEVSSHESIDLDPISVAIEEIQKKCNELTAVTTTKPVNLKLLQLVLQGAVSSSVNAGPLPMAECFLGENSEQKYTVPKRRKLRRLFKNFVALSQTAVYLNASHVSADQQLYSDDLIEKSNLLSESMQKYFDV